MSFLLEDLKYYPKDPPVIRMFKVSESKEYKVKLTIFIFNGDQVSQDTLCGRVQATSGSSIIHRNCMCSYLQCNNPWTTCSTVDYVHVNKMLVEEKKWIL